MTIRYQNVYLQDTACVCGPYEKKGPLGKYFDKTYSDFYCGESSFEKAEVKMVEDSIQCLLKKSSLAKEDIDLVVGGDLLNQIIATTYGSYGVGQGFVGIYGACSSSVLGLILGSTFIENGFASNVIGVVSSHNLTSEKQFRYPIEYGAPRPNSATFTATGAASCLLTSQKSSIRMECATIGRSIDYGQNDSNDMGRVMAPAAIDTLTRHFQETGRGVEDYDWILTGDLGVYGKEIVKEYLLKKYSIDLEKKYDDCGVLLYDLEKQKEVKAGGSGPACSPLVVYSYFVSQLRKKKIKRILFLATGALFSPLFLYQKENILSICHAVSLEVVD